LLIQISSGQGKHVITQSSDEISTVGWKIRWHISSFNKPAL